MLADGANMVVHDKKSALPQGSPGFPYFPGPSHFHPLATAAARAYGPAPTHALWQRPLRLPPTALSLAAGRSHGRLSCCAAGKAVSDGPTRAHRCPHSPPLHVLAPPHPHPPATTSYSPHGEIRPDPVSACACRFVTHLKLCHKAGSRTQHVDLGKGCVNPKLNWYSTLLSTIPSHPLSTCT
jgi:hypothetical protein